MCSSNRTGGRFLPNLTLVACLTIAVRSLVTYTSAVEKSACGMAGEAFCQEQTHRMLHSVKA